MDLFDGGGLTVSPRASAMAPALRKRCSMKRTLTALALAAALVLGSATAQTITIATGAVGQELELAQAAAQRYMDANPGVTINVLDTPDLADDRLGLYLQFFQAQSSQVDVYQIDVIWPGDLAVHFVDLFEYGAADVVGEHFPAIVENNTVDGKLIAIPWFTDAGLLYYRTDLLEKYGFDGPPATWDDLTAMATTIQEGERAAGNADFWGFVWQGNNYEGLTTNALEWQISEGGGTIVSPEGEIQVANDAMIGALERAAGWVGTISPPGVLSYVEDDARAVWHAGNAAFMRNWPYAYSVSLTSEAIGDVFAVSALPAGASGTYAATMGGWSIGVNRYSENVEAAVAFAKHFASFQEQKRRAISSSINPTIAALYQDADVIEAVPIFAGLDAVFMGAAPRPSTVTGTLYNQVSTLYSTAVHDVLSGDEDAATAMTLLELDLQALLGD